MIKRRYPFGPIFVPSSPLRDSVPMGFVDTRIQSFALHQLCYVSRLFRVHFDFLLFLFPPLPLSPPPPHLRRIYCIYRRRQLDTRLLLLAIVGVGSTFSDVVEANEEDASVANSPCLEFSSCYCWLHPCSQCSAETKTFAFGFLKL